MNFETQEVMNLGLSKSINFVTVSLEIWSIGIHQFRDIEILWHIESWIFGLIKSWILRHSKSWIWVM